ncbi:MAG TPA: hypothetical protein VKR31_04200 [Rhizomicrobium sp.]|nr:hypothetical protein [Rhizomicrobium sp.]
MAGEQKATLAASKVDARQRSSIGFPYMALDAAMELAKAIYDNVGQGQCDDAQLAAWSSQSSKSSTFRVQVYASRTFGVLEGEGGYHRLTPLGLEIVDPQQERQARVRAFLTVPLFKAVFEAYKGTVLPPTAALERELVKLGVSDKQKGRARNVLEKSADCAGFFEHGRNRLIMPGITQGAPATQKTDARDASSDNVIGGGGNGGGGLDPVIAALIQKLPKGKEPWPTDQRVAWLQMIAMAFDMAYGSDTPITITKKAEAPPA